MKRRPTSRFRRIGFGILIAGVAALIALQAVPYGRDHSNPPVRIEPRWDRARTRELAVRACFDCHSNQTRWPWYSHVAPISWLVQHDVEEGRAAVNFSEWDRPQEEADESIETVEQGTMPPWYYPWGRLSAEDHRDLARGLAATLRRPAS
jgi:hypothetical protein